MTEEFGVDRPFGDRTAVYRYILGMFAGAVCMDDSGENFFSDPTLSGY